MKKACSVCRTNCLRLHGPEEEEDEDATACRLCALRKPKGNEHVRKSKEDEHVRKSKENEHVEADRNPSFLKKLTESTMSTLKLPLSFVSDQKERLGDSVILEGPSREKWRVELHGSFQSSSLNFGQGWEKFVADHVLQVNDQLTFSLSAKSFFQVEVYDGSGCQKRSALDATNTTLNVEIKDLQSHDVSPILRKKEHSKRGIATQPTEQHLIDFRPTRPELRVRSGNYTEVAVEDMEVAENDAEVAVKDMEFAENDAEVAVNDMEVAENVAEVVVNDKEVAENDAKVAGTGMEVAGSGIEVVGDGMEVAGNEMEVAVNEMEMPGNRNEDAEVARSEDSEDSDAGGGLMKLAEVVNGGLLPEHNLVRGTVLSRRRAVTELEVVRALQAAHALKLSNPNTLMVMRNTHVYRGFWLGLPKQFREKWMPKKAQKVMLVNKGGHSWSANWMIPQGGLSGGWRRFAIDHRLEDHDVCVFELIDQTNYVLLVHIFRVLGCPGEDPGLYTPASTPSRSPVDKKNKRKSFQASNGHEADDTPGKDLDTENIRTRLSLHYEDVPVNKPTSGPDSVTKSLKRTSGLLGDDRASAPPAKTKVLSSSIHQEKLMSIGKAHIIEKLVDQASPEERAGNGAGGQVALGSTPANAIDLGEGIGATSRASCAVERTPSAPPQVLVGEKNLPIPNGSGSCQGPTARADVIPASSTDELHKQTSNLVEKSTPVEQRAPTACPSIPTRQAFKVVHIYRGRHVGNGTEFLTELEGYSERRGVATLARDDDTGFWWVPSDLFGWDMLHCNIG